MLHLNNFHEKYARQGLTIIGFNGGEGEETVLRYIFTEAPILYKIFVQVKLNRGDKYPGGGAVPYAHVIGANGKFLWHGPANDLNEKRIREFLQKRTQVLQEMFTNAPRSALNKLIQNDKGGAYREATVAVAKEKDSAKNAAAQEMAQFLETVFNERLSHVQKLMDTREYLEASRILTAMQKELQGTKLAKEVEQKLEQIKAADAQKELKALQRLESVLSPYVGKRNSKKNLAAAIGKFRALANDKSIAGTRAASKAEYYATVFEPFK